MIHPYWLEGSVLGLCLLLLLTEAFLGRTSRAAVAWAGIAGLAAVFVLTFFVDPEAASPFVANDAAALFFKRFLLVCTAVVLVLALEFAPVVAKYLPGAHPQAGLGEFYALPLAACAGMMWLASAQDFIQMFVALELVTIAFYVLVGYLRRNVGSLEAGVKYLILGALSTGFILYGIVWIYGVTGQLSFAGVAEALPTAEANNPIGLLFGFGLLLAGLGFKIAAAPFQIWVPDVYQGAPTPVTAFLSVGSKAAGFAVLMRVLETMFHAPELGGRLGGVLVVLAAITLLYGNLAAMPQSNFKRLLAYSSIGHAGFLLMALASVTGSAAAGSVAAFYLAVYLGMTLLAFLITIVVGRAAGGDDLSDFAGLGRRSPFLAAAMTVALLSLAGLPFTAGFVAKALVFLETLRAGHYVLAGIGAVAVGAGFFVYFRLLRQMYWSDGARDEQPVFGMASAVTIVLLASGLIFFGLYPAPLLEWSAGGVIESLSAGVPPR